MAGPAMNIGSGQQAIALPTRARRVDVAAGGTLDQSNTEYVLTRAISTPGTAFTIRASNITLNLNGHTVTYGTAAAAGGNSYGVHMDAWNVSGIIVANGAIEQGAGPCQGSYGEGCNPIWTNGGMAEIGGLRLTYRSGDTSGIWAPYAPARIHHNTLIDQGSVVTDRHIGIPAIATLHADGVEVDHNLIQGARHRGIDLASNGVAAYNTIFINSYATNSFGVFLYDIQDFEVHHNKIYGTGVHPIGFGPISDGGARGNIYSNYVEVENTRGGSEEGNTGAAGLRITWGGDDIVASCNYFVLKAGNAHPELAGYDNGRSWGRAVWLGGIDPGNTATVRDNYIEALSGDGVSYSAAIAVVSPGHNAGVLVTQNTVVANHSMVVLGDIYGDSGEYPRFVANTFIRRDQHPAYRTIADRLNGYWNVKGIFLDNQYLNGAALSEETVLLEFCPSTRAEVAIGSVGPGGTDVIEYYLTDDPVRIQNASSTTPFGDCGTMAIP
jgi:hypothetical protein